MKNKEFIEFYDRRIDSPYGDKWTSFTMGSCLYDFMRQRYRDEDVKEIRDEIARRISIEYNIEMETVDRFPYKGILEIIDLSDLDEIARDLYGED